MTLRLLALARQDLIQVLRQALTENPLLEEPAGAEDENAPAGGEYALTDAAERYDSIWQACVPDGWDAHGLPSREDDAPGTSAPPRQPP